MPDKDYFSFDEVLRNLKLEEDELKRLVSAGEIRAFRDKDTMRFKAEDVARLREKSPGDDLALDDLELELDEGLELDEPAATVRVETEIEELVLEDASDAAAAPEIEELDLGGDGAEAEAAVAGRAGRASRAAGAPARKTARSAEPVEAVSEGAGMLALLIGGVVVLILANFVVLDAAGGRPSNPLSRAVVNIFS